MAELRAGIADLETGGNHMTLKRQGKKSLVLYVPSLNVCKAVKWMCTVDKRQPGLAPRKGIWAADAFGIKDTWLELGQ